MPESLGDFYVWVNVPEFTLRVVKNGQVIHTERVVAGKRDTPTPIFSQDMEQVIFHPNWGVPESIKKAGRPAEPDPWQHAHLHLLPPENPDAAGATSIRRPWIGRPPTSATSMSTSRRARTTCSATSNSASPTSTTSTCTTRRRSNLFNADVRAFSHGCMRVRNPQRLAELLLAEDQGWPAQRVAAAFAPGGPQNNQVNLGRKIPVHITYFTAAVGDDGKLKQFADIYDHESKIALGLEGKAHLIPQGRKAPAQRRGHRQPRREHGAPATPRRIGPPGLWK